MRADQPRLAALAFLNRADARGQDNDDAAAALQEPAELRFIDTPLGARKAFSNAAAQGMAVAELKPSDPKATDEIMMLYRYLFDSGEISKPASGASSNGDFPEAEANSRRGSARCRCRCSDQQGGGARPPVAEPAGKPAPVVLRLPPDVLTRIDRAVKHQALESAAPHLADGSGD